MTINDPIWRYTLIGSQIYNYHGESVLQDLSNSSLITVRLAETGEYCKIYDLIITSHRIHFRSDSEGFSVRLDAVSDANIHGFFRKKVVLCVENLEISIRIVGDILLNQFLSTVNSARSQRAWLSSEGYNIRASVGGLSRVIAREDQTKSYRGSLMDVGLSDLESLKKNASDLLIVVDKLKRSSDDQKEIADLLSEYSIPDPVASNFDEKVTFILRTLLMNQPSGSLLLHDAFCLLNRSLRMERVLTPMDFLELLNRPPNDIGVLMLPNDYKLIVLRSKFDLATINKDLISLYSPWESFTVSELNMKLRFENIALTRILIERIEINFGSICRDGSDSFFLNLF